MPMYMQQPADADMGRHGEVSRMTVSGRKLTYKLKVIQQPERARACGAGAKSSADRRPVDPPPVVELRIFEGEGPEAEDITFGYNANFFLFATLEIARPIAVGRVHPPPQQQVPVLTGMPVSGMAYLDRPTEAGYFIFPDLSVRHEGQYKLSFNLYEETKEAKDADLEPSPESQAKSAGGPAGADSSFDWRLEVKSAMFHVFSAKKFPGLAESTPLSRTVAEQGCRVRIRRDVRMRRRVDGKPAGDYDEHVEEPYARGRTIESEPYQRPRSDSASSRSSEDSNSNPNQRDGEFPQAAYAPHTPQQPGPYRHLGFGSAGSQQQAPPQFAPPAPVSQPYQQHPGPPAYQPPPPPPAPPQSYRPGPPGPPGPPQPSTYMYDRQYPMSAYPTNPPRESFEPEPRRASVAYPPSHSREFPPVDSHFARPSYHPYSQRPHSPPPQSPVNLAPLKMAPIEPKLDHSSPLAPVKRIAPFPSPAYERPQPYPQYAAAPPPPPMESSRNGKRAYDSVFKSSANTQSLYNHQRPDISNAGQMYDDEDDEMSLTQMRMSYKRADGSNNSRELPPLQ